MSESWGLSIRFPGGPGEKDILIVCYNEEHMRKVYKAFQIDAMYMVPYAPLTGHRFDKIIVFRPTYGGAFSHTAMLNFERWFKEDLPLKLRPGCEKEIYLV